MIRKINSWALNKIVKTCFLFYWFTTWRKKTKIKNKKIILLKMWTVVFYTISVRVELKKANWDWAFPFNIFFVYKISLKASRDLYSMYLFCCDFNEFSVLLFLVLLWGSSSFLHMGIYYFLFDLFVISLSFV